MRRLDNLAAITAGLVLLIGVMFGSTLFQGQQFGYRDAEQYYYPLHQRTAAQWNAGHLPLWDDAENGGMSLVGNPTAAVFYPGKVIFAILPLPWASRVYLIGHVLLAFAAMAATLRRVGVGAVGSAIGGLSYGFGGPVVFQYCNAIYLVGAAWLPLGFLAADRWLRGGERRALAGLSAVLALQCLGGDVECAYVLGMFTASYALWLTVADRIRWPSWRAWLVVGLVWVVVVLVLAAILPSISRDGISGSTATWLSRAVKIVLLSVTGWAMWRRLNDRRSEFVRLCAGLLAAAVVGAMLASVQLVPVAELASQSFRASSDNRMDIYGFSLEPYRVAELIWPGFFGVEYPQNRLWLLAIPPTAGHTIWTASLYAGGLAGLLAIAALARGGPAWRGPAAVLVAASLFLSFGRYGSPLWWARYVPRLASILGPQGPSGSFFFRSEDGYVRDAFGSPYWLLASLAPGFDAFRFPAKLTVFTSFGVAALAGLGWDRTAAGSSGYTAKLARLGIGAGIAGLISSVMLGPALIAWWTRARMVPSLAGPIDAAGALQELRRALTHGTLVATACWIVAVAASRRRRWAGPAAIFLLAADLAVANSRIIWTVPQSEFERKPRGIASIEEAEAKSRIPAGPYRIARLAEWYPVGWIKTRSPDRLREIVAWERDTLQSGHASSYGHQYTLTPGVLEPEAYVDLFQPWVVELDGPASRMLGLRQGQPVRYFPRRAFDLWGARYFVLPVVADDWLDPNRATAAFLLNAEPIVVPPPDAEAAKTWREKEDWQILRNPSALPRAWIVHDVNYRTPIEPGSDESRSLKRSLLHQADPFWTIPGRPVEDPRLTAWVEVDDPKTVGLKADGSPPATSETVAITHRTPGRVEMTATLERDGLVVVADTFAPGWIATIDGLPTPIWRTNRAMRGVVAATGTHQIILSYEPVSFRIGLILSACGSVAAIALFLIRRPRREGA